MLPHKAPVTTVQVKRETPLQFKKRRGIPSRPSTIIIIIMTFIATLQLAVGVLALTNQDYQALQESIRRFVYSGQGPSRNAPLLVRSSFHDLSMFDGSNGMGPNGCLLDKTIQQVDGHQGLSTIIEGLNAHVLKEFPGIQFPFGDVISMAGKVAVESAYPCMQIKWAFGRAECKPTRPGSVPPGELATTAAIAPFLNRYGLSPTEMSILLAGSHGMQGARASTANSGYGGGTMTFANTNSGKDWIVKTFSSWTMTRSSAGKIQFTNRVENLVRMPIDLLWFPSVAEKVQTISDPIGRSVENTMKSFTSQDRSSFDQQFAQVYSKMLMVGVENTLTTFVEPNSRGVCNGNYAPAPAPPAVSTTTTLSTIVITSSTILPPPVTTLTTILPPVTSILTVVPPIFTSKPAPPSTYRDTVTVSPTTSNPVTQQTTSQFTSRITYQTTSQFTSQVTSQITSQVTSQTTSQTTSQPATETSSQTTYSETVTQTTYSETVTQTTDMPLTTYNPCASNNGSDDLCALYSSAFGLQVPTTVSFIVSIVLFSVL